jgi:hypothetical protein
MGKLQALATVPRSCKLFVQKQTKNVAVTLKSFANKEIAEVIFKTGVQIEVPDEDEVPNFSVLPEIWKRN